MDNISIIPYSGSAHRAEVIALWQEVFGYEAAHNKPELVIGFDGISPHPKRGDAHMSVPRTSHRTPDDGGICQRWLASGGGR